MPSVSKLCSLALALLAAGCAGPQPPIDVVEVPEKLRPAPGESLRLVTPAKGVQIYECRARKDATNVYDWTFVAPKADLFDARGRHVGSHYAGPHWQSKDGSKIVGEVKARLDAPNGDAIPWLLLAATSVGAEGAFSGVTSIQRVNTVGGTAPKTGCSPSAAGAMARVAYTADYYFFFQGEPQ
jgi:hypothetical protein